MTPTFFRPLATIGLLALLSGCGEAPQIDNLVQAPSRPPEALCQQVTTALRELQNQGAVVSTTPGEMTIDSAAWLELGERRRDELGQTLALTKACASADAGLEQEVVIRGETGAVLLRKVYDLAPAIQQQPEQP